MNAQVPTDERAILDGIHAVRTTVAVCCICKEQHDLRFGVCFRCSDQVAGELIADGPAGRRTHRLWDSRNPTNTVVREGMTP